MKFKKMILNETSLDTFLSMLKSGKKLTDRELQRAVRIGIQAEEEAVQLYEAIADSTNDELAKKVMQEIADEEKVHVGEFQRLLERLSKDENDRMKDGKKEVDDKI